LALRLLKSRVVKPRPCIPDGQRIYAVGDIHGQVDVLLDLFLRIDNDREQRPNANCVEVFVGDYIDRGSNTQEVVDLLVARRRARQAIFLKGNHEDYLLRFLDDPNVLSEWKNIGGLSTFASYGVHPAPFGVSPTRLDEVEALQKIATAFRQALPDSHHAFFQGLPLSFTTGDFFFVHAGVRPGVPLQQQARRDLLCIREDFLLHEESFGKVVVHGHSPTKEPEVRHNRIGIDTGAYATGRLTCLVLEDDHMSFL
jgi:serine/threonine protein phosphatase 1